MSTRRSELPGGLDLVRDFVNTLDVETGTDELDTPARLADWSRRRGLLEPGEELGEADRRRAIEVREALRQLLRANAGEDFDTRAVSSLNRVARNARLVLRFAPDGAPSLEPGAEGFEAAVARLLAVAYTSAALGVWSRLKVCGEDTCQWAFYDHSKNQSRTWCSMAVCGNRAKTRSYRQRRSPIS